MNKKIDLHIHSNFSEDADLSVAEIFELAEKSSISAISIADHDSVQSITASSGIVNNYNFEYIPGVELTTIFPHDGSQQHILGYFVDHKNDELLNALGEITKYRKEITRKRIEALRNLGFNLDEGNIIKMTGDRPPTAVSIISELFNNKNNTGDPRLHEYISGEKKEKKIMHFYSDYFSEGKAAYIPFISITSQEGIEVIIKAGGIPVLAHPVFLSDRGFLNNYIDMGIMGIEAISTYHNKEDIDFYIDFANRNKLLITAGSDYHGPTAKPHIQLGMQNGMDFIYFEKLKSFRSLTD